MKSILATLSPETLETLVCWCEDEHYKEVRKRAAKPVAEGGLALNISESTLNRLYASHNIADTKEAREEYLKQLGPEHGDLFHLTEENLQTRLLELSARPNPSIAELRLLGQIVTKLNALYLSERRVQVAERRERRLEEAALHKAETTHQETPKETGPYYTEADLEPKLTNEQTTYRMRVLLGKEFNDEGWPLEEPPQTPEQLAAPQPPEETRLTAAEISHRMAVTLGKEPENELDESIRHKEHLYQQWKQKMLKTRKPLERYSESSSDPSHIHNWQPAC